MEVTFGKFASVDEGKTTVVVHAELTVPPEKHGSFTAMRRRCPSASSMSGEGLVDVGGFSKKYRPVPANSQFVSKFLFCNLAMADVTGPIPSITLLKTHPVELVGVTFLVKILPTPPSVQV